METVLIADDEKNIRDGLKCIVDWEAYGFTICGEAANGEDALSFLLKTPPSLVLLDIRMPKLSGLDLIRIAREQGYQGHFIILSGYSDFSYAQSAIRYGVDFYLTKPIDEDELTDAITTIQRSLAHEKSVSSNIALYRERARDVIVRELITGETSDDDINTLTESDLQKLSLDASVYQVVIYEKFGLQAQDSRYSFAELLNITNNGNHTFDYYEENQKEVILLKGDFALQKFNAFLERYEQNPPQKDSPLDSLFLAYGRTVTSPYDIHCSYEDACTLMRRRFFCVQGQHTFGYMELPHIQTTGSALDNGRISTYCDSIVNDIQAANRKQMADVLFELEQYLYNTDSSISSIKLFLTDLFLQIRECISKTNMPRAAFPSNSEIIDHIEKCNYLYEIICYISEQLKQVMDASGSASRKSILDDILYYIDNNYQNNLKLETIAPLFGYNSAYLGKLFTKATGENFNSYVDHQRIERSKKLLAQNTLKVYEISEMVGYKNVDYFHKKFKKYVGISPAEYRRQNS